MNEPCIWQSHNLYENEADLNFLFQILNVKLKSNDNMIIIIFVFEQKIIKQQKWDVCTSFDTF